MRFTPEQIEEARTTDLYEYLLDNHDEDFAFNRNYLRLANNHSVYIENGSNLWIDFEDHSGGDAISFLQKFYGYTFREAVIALLQGGKPTDKLLIEQKDKTRLKRDVIKFPLNNDNNLKVYAYLRQRNIPEDTLFMLFETGLLYEDIWGNAVFVSYKKDRIEVRLIRNNMREQLTDDQSTDKQNTINNRYWTDYVYSDCFWYLGKGGDTVYITEGAIDAISLYELLGRKKAIYASMPGVGNQQIINRIKHDGRYRVVLCVDNDDAGQNCRDRNPDLKTLIPPDPYKDWNEMLVAGIPLPQ